MAKKRHRAFAAFGAILFLVTSSALTIAVIISLASSKSSSGSDTSGSSTSGSSTGSNSTAKSTNSNSIAGTKLSDFTPTSTPQTKLQIIDTKVGTGETAKAGDTITADYVGALMKTGVVFDASQDHGGPQTFSLSQVIAGWSQGIPGMKVGGTRRLLIPASLGYGTQGSGSTIPPNSDLVFDITLTKIAS
jgi:FKBP-type peptidyl-prolyl cis-trans isomerase FkpA